MVGTFLPSLTPLSQFLPFIQIHVYFPLWSSIPSLPVSWFFVILSVRLGTEHQEDNCSHLLLFTGWTHENADPRAACSLRCLTPAAWEHLIHARYWEMAGNYPSLCFLSPWGRTGAVWTSWGPQLNSARLNPPCLTWKLVTNTTNPLIFFQRSMQSPEIELSPSN